MEAVRDIAYEIPHACDCHTCRLLRVMEPERAHYRSTPEREESLLLLKAIRLSPTLDMCERILRGEPVPKSKLDPEWAKAYGIR